MNKPPTGPLAETRVHLYEQIAVDLRKRIQSGEYRPGVLLPSENRLATAYGASRLTVKRALAALRKEGLLDARQGFGWFVPGGSVRHGLSELSTIEEGVAAMGLSSTRQVLEFAFVEADATVNRVLGHDQVLKTVRLNLADSRPVAHVTTWCPAELGARLSRADVESHSLYDLLPVEIGSATQVIRAVGADATDARLLDIRQGLPCLRSERTTFSVEGEPVLYAIAVFPGHTTEYVADLKWQGRPGDTIHSLRLIQSEVDLDVG